MTRASGREDFADELRGFALLGIAVVNAPFLGISSEGFTDASLASTLDRVVAFCVVALAQAKFYLLFSFLFGYSLSFFLASQTDDQFRAFRRRLVGLGAVGLVHAWLFFIGDILFVYAVLGLAIPWLVRRSDRFALRTAWAAGVVWLLWLGLLVVGEATAPVDDSQWRMLVLAWDTQLATGTFLQAVAARVSLWPYAQMFIFALNGLAVFSMFGVGLVAGRRKLLARPEDHGALWWRGLLIGLLLGLPGGIASAWLSIGSGAVLDSGGFRHLLGVAIGFATAPALALGYVALLGLARTRWRDALRPFRPAGRMSLTGYIGESMILATVFCGYGLGLFGRVGAATAVALAVVAWLLLDAFAHLWQRRFAYGPLEYLLRWWTHARRPSAAHRPLRST